MAIRDIVKVGDEILRKTSKEVLTFDEKLSDLIDDMFDTLRKAEGAGLAAPQVGILKRVVVIDIGEGPVEMVNPTIISQGPLVCVDEGCLSVPGRSGKVMRPKSLKVEAFDRHGNKKIYSAKGYFAQAVSHEVDHLDGVLYIDKEVSAQDCAAAR